MTFLIVNNLSGILLYTFKLLSTSNNKQLVPTALYFLTIVPTSRIWRYSTTMNGTMCQTGLWEMLWTPLFSSAASFFIFLYMQFTINRCLCGKRHCPTFKQKRTRASIPDTAKLKFVQSNEKWRAANLLVALCHSILSGVWSITVLSTQTGLYFQDFVNASSPEAQYLSYVSFGFMLQDVMTLIYYKSGLDKLVFHLIMMCAFLISHLYCVMLYVLLFALLMELHAAFVHIHALLDMYGVQLKSKLFFLFYISTFVLFRIAVNVFLFEWMMYKCIELVMKWYSKISITVLILTLTSANLWFSYHALVFYWGKWHVKNSLNDGSDGSMKGNQLESVIHSSSCSVASKKPLIEQQPLTNQRANGDSNCEDESHGGSSQTECPKCKKLAIGG